MIVGIGIDPAVHLSHIPFRTVILLWELDALETTEPSDIDGLYRELMEHTRQLMTTLGVREDE